MAVAVECNWRGLKSGAQKTLGAIAKSKIRDFFRYIPDEYNERTVHFLGIKVISGADPQKIIKFATKNQDFGHHAVGIPVIIQVDGGQGLVCLLTIEGLTDDEIRILIQNGPYDKKPRVSKEAADATSEVVSGDQSTAEIQALALATASGGEATETKVDVVKEPSSDPVVKPMKQEIVKRRPPLEILTSGSGGWTTEKIERLKSTLSYLISNHVTEEMLSTELNSVYIKVSYITAAILEHMEINQSSAGNYRGTVASFYTSVIALFALKGLEDSAMDERSTPWLFDLDVVLDFVGGKDNLSALARGRRKEIEERTAKEKALPPPVPAEEVETAAASNVDDNDLINLALAALSGRKEAERELAAAEANLSDTQASIQEIENLLLTKRAELARAKAFVGEMRQKVESFTVSNEVRARVVEAIRKAQEEFDRMQKLAKDLGISST
jgi:hypothetical protein